MSTGVPKQSGDGEEPEWDLGDEGDPDGGVESDVDSGADLGPDSDADANPEADADPPREIAAEPTVVTRAVRADAPPHWEEIDQGHGARMEVTIPKVELEEDDWSGEYLILAIAEDGVLLSSVEGKRFSNRLVNECKLKLAIPGKPDLQIDGFIDSLSITGNGSHKIKVNFRNATAEQTEQLRDAIAFLKTEAPKRPEIRKPRSWVRRAVFGAIAGAALTAAGVAGYISTSDSDTSDEAEVAAFAPEPLLPLRPLEPLRPGPRPAPAPAPEQTPTPEAKPAPKDGTLVSDCDVDYHPERDTHSVACDVTKKAGVKPRITWKKMQYAGYFNADVSFDLNGETCTSDEPMLIIAKEDGTMMRMRFTCAAPQQ